MLILLNGKLIYLSQLIVMAGTVIMNGLEMKIMPLDDVSKIMKQMASVQSMPWVITLFGVILSYTKSLLEEIKT